MKKSVLLLTLTLVSSFAAGVQGPPSLCSNVFHSETKLDQKAFENIAKSENSFVRHRGIHSYHQALGEAFAEALSQGVQGSKEFHWLDSGGGEGNAIAQFLASVPEPGRVKTTLLAYETPAVANERMAVLKGRFIENIPQGEIPASDLITDVYGPMAYSSRPDLVLSKYLQALKPHGKILLSLGHGYGVFGHHNKVSLEDGRLLTFKDWLLGLPGLQVKLRELVIPNEFNKGELVSVEITLNEDGSLPEIPALDLLNMKNGMPPEMIFREIRRSPSPKPSSPAFPLQGDLQEKYSQSSATRFLDSFRAGVWTGSWTHALLASLRKLQANDSWLILAPSAEKLREELLSGNFQMKESSYSGLGQSFTSWRAKGIFQNFPGRIETPRWETLPRQGSTRLITDYAGPLQASSRPDLVLKAYLESLSPEGELYLFLGDGKAGYGEQSFVLDARDQKVYFLSWLGKIPGLSVKSYRDPYAKNGVSFVRIRIRSKNKIQIPELEFLGTGDKNGDGVPSPLFRETGKSLSMF